MKYHDNTPWATYLTIAILVVFVLWLGSLFGSGY